MNGEDQHDRVDIGITTEEIIRRRTELSLIKKAEAVTEKLWDMKGWPGVDDVIHPDAVKYYGKGVLITDLGQLEISDFGGALSGRHGPIRFSFRAGYRPAGGVLSLFELVDEDLRSRLEDFCLRQDISVAAKTSYSLIAGMILKTVDLPLGLAKELGISDEIGVPDVNMGEADDRDVYPFHVPIKDEEYEMIGSALTHLDRVLKEVLEQGGSSG